MRAGRALFLGISADKQFFERENKLEPLADFKANPAGSSIVNAVGPIRQVVRGEYGGAKRYLVIAAGTMAKVGAPVQVQVALD